MVWKIYESGLTFNIEAGQVGDINITQGDPPLPTVGETTAEILSNGLIIIRWNLKLESVSARFPDWISLELFKPKGPYDNPDTPLFDIPPPINNGDEIVRADDIGNQAPTKEHSDLWKDYINEYWEYITPFYRLDVDFPQDYYEVDNERWSCREDPLDLWPGPNINGEDLSSGRTVHHMRYISTDIVSPINLPIPFRVAEPVGGTTDVEVTRKLLALLLIKRMGRLRLKAWSYTFKINIPQYRVPSGCYDCFIATAAYGSPFAPEVQFLREIRDNKLKITPWGTKVIEKFESIYYTFSPQIAALMIKNRRLGKTIRWIIVAPIVHTLSLAVNFKSKLSRMRRKIS